MAPLLDLVRTLLLPPPYLHPAAGLLGLNPLSMYPRSLAPSTPPLPLRTATPSSILRKPRPCHHPGLTERTPPIIRKVANRTPQRLYHTHHNHHDPLEKVHMANPTLHQPNPTARQNTGAEGYCQHHSTKRTANLCLHPRPMPLANPSLPQSQ